MPKTVFITGTSSGIGKATAQYFSECGWNVAATMRSPKKDTEVNKFKHTKVFEVDVTDSSSIEKAIANVLKEFGQIDVVVNNAGYGVDGVFEAMTDDVIQKQFDTNVFGLMRVTSLCTKYFRTNKIPGTIIQVASMGGRITFPLYSIYHGTKWAVEGFSESFQYEVRAFGIRVKLIEPGSIQTNFYTSSRQAIKPTDTKDYDNFVAQCENLSIRSGQGGVDPSVVAKTIYKAASDTSWTFRYPVGDPAPLLLAMRRVIPDWLWFTLMRMAYKI